MKRTAISTALTLAAAAPITLPAADAFEPESRNRFSLGARFGMNFKAAFHNRASVIPANPGPAAGGANHQYDDGYVRVDSSGNQGGRTWNWGYQNDSQVVGGTVEFHSTDSQGSSLPSTAEVTGDPQPGLELVYQRVLGPSIAGSRHRWGMEAGFGYMDVDLEEKLRRNGMTTVTTDAYQLDGVVPPSGYQGTFEGPGPLLGDIPARSTVSSMETQSSRQKLSGQLYTIRLGPFAEWNINPQWSVAASVGLTLAPANIDYDFSETTPSPGGAVVTRGHSSKTDVLYGAYLGGALRYDFTRNLGVYVGVQFQSLTELRQTSGTRSARLDPRATFYGTVGASWRF